MAKALRAGAVHTEQRNKARGSHWRVVWKGSGRERGEGKGEWQGFAAGGGNVWVFSDDVMELAENTSLLLECKQ